MNNPNTSETVPDFSDDMATLCMVTVDAWHGSKGAVDWLKGNLQQFTPEEIEEHKLLRYFNFLLALSLTEDRETFLLDADEEMMEILRGLMPEEEQKKGKKRKTKNQPELKTFEEIQRMVTLAALRGGRDAEELIRGIIERTPKKAGKSAQGKKNLRYLNFLLGLAGADDKEEYLRQADQETINIIEQYLPKEESNSTVTAMLGKLTQEVYDNQPAALSHIGEIKTRLSDEMLESEEGENLIKYLAFLQELAEAGDKDAYLLQADEAMIILMQQIMSDQQN